MRKMPLMKALLVAVLYAGFALGANPVLAGGYDPDALKATRSGEMRKLAVLATPNDMNPTRFVTVDGTELDFTAFRGKTVLLNFWATWCAPCRIEMPTLDALQADLGGEDFEVVIIATGRNPIPAIKSFFKETGIENLTIYRDPGQALARNMGVFGLPTTMILDTEGREVARMRGDADWFSEDAVRVLKAVIAQHSDPS
jgi:thiol-disulfide isomerase/thioredoxin